MSADHQLLEFAAKAAGYIPATQDSGAPFVIFDGEDPRDWDPLEDDGDALRLAVKLDMQIWRNTDGTVSGMPPSVGFWNRGKVDLATDPYAATRRAIVNAAAEIGRNMIKEIGS